MNQSNQTDLLYTTFKNAGVAPSLVAMFSFKVFISALGALFNAALIVVTIRSKSLHGKCNLLIAIHSAITIPQHLNHLIPFFIVLSGKNFILLSDCFLFQCICVFATTSAFPFGLFIGMDRLFAVLFPIWYKNRNGKIYLLIIVILGIIPGLNVVYRSAIASSEKANLMVMCTVSDPAQYNNSWISIQVIVFNVSTVCCYLLTGIFLLFTNIAVHEKRIFKSLSIILAIEIFGWLLNNSLRLYFGSNISYNVSALDIFFILNWFSGIPYIGLMLNAPMLYYFSKEYKRAFQRHFCIVAGWFGYDFSSFVGNSSVNMQNNNNNTFHTNSHMRIQRTIIAHQTCT